MSTGTIHSKASDEYIPDIHDEDYEGDDDGYDNDRNDNNINHRNNYDDECSTGNTVFGNDKVDNEAIPTYIGLSGSRLSKVVSAMASVGFLLFGYDQGVMGSLLTLDSFREQFPEIDATSDGSKSTLQGFTIAVYEIGCLIGALSTIYSGDKLGRLKIMMIGCSIMVIGAIIQCSSFSLAQLIVGRVVTGLGNGMNTSTIPMWQSECAKPEMRGKLVMISGGIIAAGIAISYWIDFGFYFATGEVAWRFPVAFQIIFPAILLPFLPKLPESPRWLAKKGRYNEATYVLAALDGVPIDHQTIVKEVSEIKHSLEEEVNSGADKFDFRLLFTQGEHKNFHRVCLGVWSQIFQQITGINLITYYAGTIFENYIGMSPLKSRILAACNGTEYVLASIIAYYTIEKFGRRQLMLFGATGQAITMGLLTACTWAANRGNNAAAIVDAVLLFVFNSFFAVGWLGMSWLYQAEIPPLSVRAPSNALSTASNWAFNFMVVMITPIAFDQIGPYTYTIFAVINALMIPAVYFFFPETAGRSLEEMDRIFAECDKTKPWQVVKIANEYPYENPENEPDFGFRKKKRQYVDYPEKIVDDEHVENCGGFESA